jgi:hypothetical protein
MGTAFWRFPKIPGLGGLTDMIPCSVLHFRTGVPHFYHHRSGTFLVLP